MPRRQPPSRSAHRREMAPQQEETSGLLKPVDPPRPPPPPHSLHDQFVSTFSFHRVTEDAFRTVTVLCTVIIKDKPGDSLVFQWGRGSINKDYFSLSLSLSRLMCTASVDTASSCSGVICDEVFIVYTGCCQLRCLKYLTIIIYY